MNGVVRPGNLRLLFVTTELAWPIGGGGPLRRWHVLQAMLGCGTVDAVVSQPAGKPVAEQAYRGCRRVVVIDDRLLQYTPLQRRAYESTLGRAAMLAGTVSPMQFLGADNRRLARWFAELVEREAYDAIWMSYPWLAARLGWRDPRRTIMNAENLEYLLNYQLLRSSPWYGAKAINYADVLKMACWERQLSRWYARVAYCSEDDRQRMAARNAVVIPNGAAIPPSCPRKPSPRLLLVGSLSYAPNQAGAQWFVKEIWPLVRQQLPEAAVDIVGGEPGEWLLAHDGREGIRVHGFVRDLRPFWEQSAASLAPLLAGSGTRFKILESLAYAVPVVSTRIGASGLEFGDDAGVMLADTPIEFAQRCIEVLHNPERHLACAQRGRQLVEARYSWEQIHKKIQSLVRQVAGEAGAGHNGRRGCRSVSQAWTRLPPGSPKPGKLAILTLSQT